MSTDNNDYGGTKKKKKSCFLNFSLPWMISGNYLPSVCVSVDVRSNNHLLPHFLCLVICFLQGGWIVWNCKASHLTFLFFFFSNGRYYCGIQGHWLWRDVSVTAADQYPEFSNVQVNSLLFLVPCHWGSCWIPWWSVKETASHPPHFFPYLFLPPPAELLNSFSVTLSEYPKVALQTQQLWPTPLEVFGAIVNSTGSG